MIPWGSSEPRDTRKARLSVVNISKIWHALTYHVCRSVQVCQLL